MFLTVKNWYQIEKEENLLYEKTKKNLSFLRFMHRKQTGWSSQCFSCSSIQKQLQFILPSFNFPFSYRLSVSDVGGTAILKGRWSKHLTSFPNTGLPLQ